MTGPALQSRTSFRVVVSAGFGVLCAALPILEPKLPYIPGLHELAGDFIWLPGGFVASLVYPEGAHTGTGTRFYMPLVLGLNWLIYSGLAFLAIIFSSRFRAASH